MKRCLLGIVLACLPLAAVGQGLTVGIVRDQDGAVVPGASIVAHDAAGKAVASARAGSDGTFVLEAASIATIDVTCEYCAPVRGLVPRSPLLLAVTRFRALVSTSPNDRDVAALPYARAENVAALTPFVLVSGQTVSFGLDRGTSLVATTGIPAYRISDGGTPIGTLPDHYVDRIVVTPPPEGFRYGSYADGGTFDFQPFADERAAVRLDGGPDESVALKYALPGVAAAAGASLSGGVHRRRADVVATSDLLGGTFQTVASLAGNDGETYAALGAHYATASRRYETLADANVFRSALVPRDGGMAAASGSALFTDFRVRNRGPLGLELGARLQSSTGNYMGPYGAFGVAGAYREAAVYGDIAFEANGNSLQAAAGLTELYRSGYAYGSGTTTVAPIGSLQYAYALGPSFSLTAGGSALTRLPTLEETAAYDYTFHALLPVDRDQLVTAGIAYTDRSRVRAELEAYRERIDGAGTSVDAGLGVSVAWQIAPSLALRTWALAPSQAPGTGAVSYYASTTPIRTTSVWLTYDAGVRFDAIYSGRHIDGDLNVPVAPNTTLRIGRDASGGWPRYVFGLRYVR